MENSFLPRWTNMFLKTISFQKLDDGIAFILGSCDLLRAPTAVIRGEFYFWPSYILSILILFVYITVTVISPGISLVKKLKTKSQKMSQNHMSVLHHVFLWTWRQHIWGRYTRAHAHMHARTSAHPQKRARAHTHTNTHIHKHTN